MKAEQIKEMIESNLENSTAIVEGEDGQHFYATVITDGFKDLRPIQRQRMVYSSLGDNIQNGTIHALSLKTYTQTEWQQLSS